MLLQSPSRSPLRPSPRGDLLCFSHLRWDFVFQRPQHLMTRLAATRRVYYIEEPSPHVGEPRLDVRRPGGGITVVVPRLTAAQIADGTISVQLQRQLLDALIVADDVRSPVCWYYTPMALPFSDHLRRRLTVYDCMDELSNFKGAPPQILQREDQLFARADLVFTGGRSLYEAKRARHRQVFCFPSSVDVAHFGRARSPLRDPEDQAGVPRPRIGYAGVIDERIDLPLIAGIASARPQWQVMMLGPVVKIDPAVLPKHPNVHYLGMKSYLELPEYLAGWDVAMLPFARNDATRFISPTKTPEYLAAGRPVVSTSIRDVVRPYGKQGLAEIADEPSAFVAAVERALTVDRRDLRRQADQLLARTSWDQTASEMVRLMEAATDPALTAELEDAATNLAAV